MAKGLEVGEWVGRVDGKGEILRSGFIIESVGSGFWDIQFTTPEFMVDTAGSRKLVRLSSKLDENQKEHLKKLYINLALDSKNWNWLSELREGKISRQ
jgi:hypothetical protein